MNMILRELSELSYGETILVLRIVAWEKLSKKGCLADELKFTENKKKEDVFEIFRNISKQESLGWNRLGFDVDNNENISDERFTLILEKVSYLLKNQIADYKYFTEKNLDPAGIHDEIAKLMKDLAAIGKNDRVYVPFTDDAYRIAIFAGREGCDVFTESAKKTPVPYLLNLIENININPRFGDPIASPSWIDDGKLNLYDTSITFPALEERYRKDAADRQTDCFCRFPEKAYYSEVLYIRHTLAQTEKRAVVAASPGMLQRTSGGEKDFKRSVIEDGILKSVIALPHFLLPNTPIPFALMIFDKKVKNENIHFIDASSDEFFEKTSYRKGILKNAEKIIEMYRQNAVGEYSCFVSPDKCKKNEYNLFPNRYIPSPKFAEIMSSDPKQLSDIAELFRAQSVKNKKDEGGEGFYEVNLSDIPDNGIITEANISIKVPRNKIEMAKKWKLYPGDILLGVKGSIGRVGIISENMKSENWIPSQAFQVIRLKDSELITHAYVLFVFFRSEVGQKILENRRSGTSVPLIQVRDMKKFPIIIPALEEQKKIIGNFKKEMELFEKIEKIKGEIDDLRKYWSL